MRARLTLFQIGVELFVLLVLEQLLVVLYQLGNVLHQLILGQVARPPIPSPIGLVVRRQRFVVLATVLEKCLLRNAIKVGALIIGATSSVSSFGDK